MGRHAKIGQRVADRHGKRGVVESVNSYIVTVRWGDGTWSELPAGAIHKARGGSRWKVYVAAALLLGLTVTLLAWLL